jgi:hypothetical protein
MAGRIDGTRSVVQGGSFNLSLYSAYTSTCLMRPTERVPCTEDELPPSNGKPRVEPSSDAGADAGGDAAADAATDAGADGAVDSDPPANQCFKTVSGCDGFDDFEVATRGIHTGDLWVTRLRADLPVSALATDLRLEAADQSEVSAQHHTEKFSDPKFDPCGANGANGANAADSDGGCACRTSRPLGSSFGMWLIVGLTATLASKIARRHGRR